MINYVGLTLLANPCDRWYNRGQWLCRTLMAMWESITE